MQCTQLLLGSNYILKENKGLRIYSKCVPAGEASISQVTHKLPPVLFPVLAPQFRYMIKEPISHCMVFVLSSGRRSPM